MLSNFSYQQPSCHESRTVAFQINTIWQPANVVSFHDLNGNLLRRNTSQLKPSRVSYFTVDNINDNDTLNVSNDNVIVDNLNVSDFFYSISIHTIFVLDFRICDCIVSLRSIYFIWDVNSLCRQQQDYYVFYQRYHSFHFDTQNIFELYLFCYCSLQLFYNSVLELATDFSIVQDWNCLYTISLAL